MQFGQMVNVSAAQASLKLVYNVCAMVLKQVTCAISAHINQILVMCLVPILVSAGKDLLTSVILVYQVVKTQEMMTQINVALEHILIKTIKDVWHVQMDV